MIDQNMAIFELFGINLKVLLGKSTILQVIYFWMEEASLMHWGLNPKKYGQDIQAINFPSSIWHNDKLDFEPQSIVF
jgi:hypothetical protein